jgi:fused signal recognition particle receptor
MLKKRKHKSSETLRQCAAELKKLTNSIMKSFDDNVKAGNISSYDSYVLSELLGLLYKHLYADIQEFKEEGVTTMFGDGIYLRCEYEFAERLEKKVEELEERMQEQVREQVQEQLQVQVREQVQEQREQMQEQLREQMQEQSMIEKFEIAKNLLAQGLSPENIAAAIKISVESVRQLHVAPA